MPVNSQGNPYNRYEQMQQKGVKPANFGQKGTIETPKEPLKC